MHKIVCSDATDYVRSLTGNNRTIFMDPPDNIGLGYNTYKDNNPSYFDWLENLIQWSIKKCSILWISHYYKWDLEITFRLRNILKFQHPTWHYRRIIWRFTFGNYKDNDLTNGYRSILLLTAPNAKMDFDSIRTISERMLLGDPRAAGPRIPDDVWDVPRVTGNSKERRGWHPTQHPEQLMERIIKISGPQSFVDLFGGTGTSLRVGIRLGIPITHVELDQQYCENVSKETEIAIQNNDFVH